MAGFLLKKHFIDKKNKHYPIRVSRVCRISLVERLKRVPEKSVYVRLFKFYTRPDRGTPT